MGDDNVKILENHSFTPIWDTSDKSLSSVICFNSIEKLKLAYA